MFEGCYWRIYEKELHNVTDKRIATLILETFPCLRENGRALHLGCSGERHVVMCPAVYRYRAERLVSKILRSTRRITRS